MIRVVEEGAYQDPEFMATYEALGDSPEVSAKGQATVQLRLILSAPRE